MCLESKRQVFKEKKLPHKHQGAKLCTEISWREGCRGSLEGTSNEPEIKETNQTEIKSIRFKIYIAYNN